MSIAFEDINTYNGSSAYRVPNEDIGIWRDIVKGMPIQKAAAICSSGEIGLLSILPTVRKNLVMVDHNYGSLYIAMIKYMILKEKGYAETYRMFVEQDNAAIDEAVTLVKKNLPQAILRYSTDRYCDSWSPNAISGLSNVIAKTWKQVPPVLFKSAEKKLEQVKFIHGDISDLETEGPFGLLYISNALGHRSRLGRPSTLVDKIEKVVGKNGLVMLATSSSGDDSEIRGRRWEKISEKVRSSADRDTIDGFNINWNQRLYRINQ